MFQSIMLWIGCVGFTVMAWAGMGHGAEEFVRSGGKDGRDSQVAGLVFLVLAVLCARAA